MLQLNCTSEPSHPASHLKWEVNKRPVEEDNYVFNEILHQGKKLFVTRIGLRIRLTKDHFHWGKLKVSARQVERHPIYDGVVGGVLGGGDGCVLGKGGGEHLF